MCLFPAQAQGKWAAGHAAPCHCGNDIDGAGARACSCAWAAPPGTCAVSQHEQLAAFLLPRAGAQTVAHGGQLGAIYGQRLGRPASASSLPRPSPARTRGGGWREVARSGERAAPLSRPASALALGVRREPLVVAREGSAVWHLL